MATNIDLINAIRNIAAGGAGSNASYRDELRVLHGFVKKYNKGENGRSGTIDFATIDGTVMIDGVSVASIAGLEKGNFCEPTPYSDVTVLWKVGTGDATVISFSHVDVQRVNATNEVVISVTPENHDDEKDYNEQENSGESIKTVYNKEGIVSSASNKDDTASFSIHPTKITSETKEAIVEQENDKITATVGGSSQEITKDGITMTSQSIKLGGDDATEQALLGTQTAALLVDFITACSQITTPTMLGTMPIINIPQFTALLPRCEQIKSQLIKLK